MAVGTTMGRQPVTSPISLYLKAGLFGIFALFGLTILFGSWYTVDQTERGVLLRNGAIVEVVQPGLHFKTPWIESVYKVDMKTETFNWEKVNSYSADQQPADLKISVTFRVDPNRVSDVYSRFGGDLASAVQRLISPNVNKEAKIVFGHYTALKAIQNRDQLNIDTSNALKDSLAYDPMFVIEGVQIENIDFSQQYIHSIEQRMQAEVEVQRLQQNLQREKVQAEIRVTQATAEANSTLATARANSEAIKLQGDAQASAIKARAAALGDNPNLIALTQAEKWNGSLPTTMIPGGAVPFLNVMK